MALYVSGQMSLEAQYLSNKLAKGFIGTSWIESNSRLCMASAGTGYKLSLGADGPPGSYQDIDRADLFVGRPWVLAGHDGITYRRAGAIEDLILDVGAVL